MPRAAIDDLELDVRLVGDADRGERRQVQGQRPEDLLDERTRPEHDFVHREQPGDLRRLGPPHGQPRPVETQRESAAGAGRFGEHGHDVGEHLAGHVLLEFRPREQLRRLDGPLAEPVGGVGERRPDVHGFAHPRIGGPRAADAHDRVIHLDPHPDDAAARSARGFRGSRRCGGGVRGKERIEVAVVLLVECDVRAQAFDPHPPEIAEGGDDRGQAVAHLDAAHRDR